MSAFKKLIRLLPQPKSLIKRNINGINRKYFTTKAAVNQTFTVYRWDPTKDSSPEEVSYNVDVSGTPMILDVLFKIKNEQDPTLSFRRSCREGICGSCAMNIDGTNTLACLAKTKPGAGQKTRILPLPVIILYIFIVRYDNII